MDKINSFGSKSVMAKAIANKDLAEFNALIKMAYYYKKRPVYTDIFI